MIPRLLDLPLDQSFFLFGARNTGKSTLIKKKFNEEISLYIDLLKPQLEEKFSKNPEELYSIVKALPSGITHVVIDEIQKIPKLLDVVHDLIETTDKKFVMTGSSARKLKSGGANLLAGRAFVYDLYPFSFLELKENFDLNIALNWGQLPKIYDYQLDASKKKFLQAYSLTYLKEEIWSEQIIKNLDPFRKFLEVAAQGNGKIINISNVATDVGVDDKTIKNYYSILEDTLVGFFLEAFQHSFRKRLSKKPKFYFFDNGVAKALSNLLTVKIIPGTSMYGELFESFIILECIKLSKYANNDFRFSYLHTKEGVEIDLVVERPGNKILFLEIKSSNNITEKSISSFIRISKEFKDCEAVCFCNEVFSKVIENVKVMPWQEGIKEYFQGDL